MWNTIDNFSNVIKAKSTDFSYAGSSPLHFVCIFVCILFQFYIYSSVQSPLIFIHLKFLCFLHIIEWISKNPSVDSSEPEES